MRNIVAMYLNSFLVIPDRVNMYVYEEMVDGKKLSDIINEEHENVKYLPGHKLPTSVVAVPDLVEASKEADILVFVIPHQFIRNICKQLSGKIKKTAVGLSMIKGFDIAESGGIDLISNVITKNLQVSPPPSLIIANKLIHV
jgi:glycerol-3-phosphate dehydrogenase (NAD+)